MVLRALHILHTEFATENILQGIVASSKLAMLFEILELYSDAELVLEETVARVRICREHLAEGTESIDSVTCSLNMHREFSEVSDLASLSHRQKNQSSLITLNTRRPLSSSKGGNNSSSSSPDSHSSEINQCSSLPYLHTHGIDASFLLNKLPCCELDLIAALVRCNMKQRYHTNVARQLKSDREFERLTNKKAPVTIVVARPIDEDVQRICASSLPSKAILNCTYAVSGKNIPLEERFVMLKQAYDLIQHESQNEKLLLRELQATLSDLNPTTSSASTAATICSTSKYPAPTFLRRTFHSITVNVKKDQDVAA